MLMAQHMCCDTLLPSCGIVFQVFSFYLEGDDLHSQNCGVKMSGFVQISNCEHHVIQMTDVNWTGTSEAD